MREVAAERRCELCGALRTEYGTDFHRPETAEMVDFMAWFMSLSVRHMAALRLFVQMALYPNDSIAKCAARCGVSRQRAEQLLARLESDQPMLRDSLLALRPACGSQRLRRAFERMEGGGHGEKGEGGLRAAGGGPGAGDGDLEAAPERLDEAAGVPRADGGWVAGGGVHGMAGAGPAGGGGPGGAREWRGRGLDAAAAGAGGEAAAGGEDGGAASGAAARGGDRGGGGASDVDVPGGTVRGDAGRAGESDGA